MMRTYLSPVSEEETDFSKITIRKEIYASIVKGYYSELKEELSEAERKSFFFSGKCMIYMQALRFLTDYLNDDMYYGATYPEQNFVRAGNQCTGHAKIEMELCTKKNRLRFVNAKSQTAHKNIDDTKKKEINVLNLVIFFIFQKLIAKK